MAMLVITRGYIFIWVNYYNDLTVLPKPGMVNKRNHPKMAEPFRLVKYYNLPRFMGYLDAYF